MKQTAVDLEDDLEVPRQHLCKPRQWPLFQRFGQQRVVGVCNRSLRDVPGFVPSQMLIVQEDPHQLRNGHRRMSVVKLNGGLLGKRAPIRIGAPETARQIGQRAGDEEVLLHEAQPLPKTGRIIRVEYACERFRFECLGHGADEIAVAECLKIEEIGRSRGPKAKCIDILAAVAHHGTIEGHANQTGWPTRDRAQSSTAYFKRAVQFDFDTFLRARYLPATSQGSWRRSQLSGRSRCHPFSMDCLKMPYSYRRP